MSKTRTPLIGAALIAAIALSVPATGASAKGMAGMMGGVAALEFEHFDQNGDGSLTRDELRDVHKARFNAADSNGDGELSAEEMQAAAEARRTARYVRMVERLDTDGNGTVSAEEMEAARDRMHERRGQGRDNGRDHARKDGGKRWQERGEHRRADRGDHRGMNRGGHHSERQARGGAMFEQMFALADTDGNGTLSKEEFDSAKARLADARATRPSAPAAPDAPEAPQDN